MANDRRLSTHGRRVEQISLAMTVTMAGLTISLFEYAGGLVALSGLLFSCLLCLVAAQIIEGIREAKDK
jgi:hypothetical protein